MQRKSSLIHDAIKLVIKLLLIHKRLYFVGFLETKKNTKFNDLKLNLVLI